MKAVTLLVAVTAVMAMICAGPATADVGFEFETSDIHFRWSYKKGKVFHTENAADGTIAWEYTADYAGAGDDTVEYNTPVPYATTKAGRDKLCLGLISMGTDMTNLQAANDVAWPPGGVRAHQHFTFHGKSLTAVNNGNLGYQPQITFGIRLGQWRAFLQAVATPLFQPAVMWASLDLAGLAAWAAAPYAALSNEQKGFLLILAGVRAGANFIPMGGGRPFAPKQNMDFMLRTQIRRVAQLLPPLELAAMQAPYAGLALYGLAVPVPAPLTAVYLTDALLWAAGDFANGGGGPGPAAVGVFQVHNPPVARLFPNGYQIFGIGVDGPTFASWATRAMNNEADHMLSGLKYMFNTLGNLAAVDTINGHADGVVFELRKLVAAPRAAAIISAFSWYEFIRQFNEGVVPGANTRLLNVSPTGGGAMAVANAATVNAQLDHSCTAMHTLVAINAAYAAAMNARAAAGFIQTDSHAFRRSRFSARLKAKSKTRLAPMPPPPPKPDTTPQPQYEAIEAQLVEALKKKWAETAAAGEQVANPKTKTYADTERPAVPVLDEATRKQLGITY